MTTERTDLQPELENHLRFESMLADLFSRFVNLEPGEVDRANGDAQRRICECLGFDMAVLWQRSVENQDDLRLTHLHRPALDPARHRHDDSFS